MNIGELKQKVLKIMRNPEVYFSVSDYVEKHIKYVFGVACEQKLSINEWLPDSEFGDQKGQKTVFLTARMFDLWEFAIVEELKKRLEKLSVKVEHNHDQKGDMVIIFPNKSKMIWEIKSSQAESSWTGATHSSSKTSHYILINYALNRNLKLDFGENKGFITKLAIFVWNDMRAKWRGEPSKKSSWTTLKIPSEIARNRPEIKVIGDWKLNSRWCKIIRKNLVVPL